MHRIVHIHANRITRRVRKLQDSYGLIRGSIGVRSLIPHARLRMDGVPIDVQVAGAGRKRHLRGLKFGFGFAHSGQDSLF